MTVRPVNSHLSWLSVPSSFPASNSPIYHIPTCRVNHRIDGYGTAIWQTRIDQIISRRLDRKGIIFTVSYARRDYLLRHSQHSGIMVTHQSHDVIQQVERFKRMLPPAVLVSPTVTTGWSFDWKDLSLPVGVFGYLIVGKVPYPDTSDAVTQARHEDDPEWTSFQAMDTLVQECGRMTRSATDKCEVLVIDSNIVWFVRKYAAFAPDWFRARYRGSLSSVPGPMV